MREGYCIIWSVRLCVCVCVCVCVCLSVNLYSRTAGNEAAGELYTRLQRNKRSNNNVADLAERLRSGKRNRHSRGHVRDPTLARAHAYLLHAWAPFARLAQPLDGAALPGVPRCCIMLLQVPLACFRTVVSVPGYVPHGSCCRSCVSQLLVRAAPVAYTNRVCAEGLHFSALH